MIKYNQSENANKFHFEYKIKNQNIEIKSKKDELFSQFCLYL